MLFDLGQHTNVFTNTFVLAKGFVNIAPPCHVTMLAIPVIMRPS